MTFERKNNDKRSKKKTKINTKGISYKMQFISEFFE
jgi:hypothetical protein